MIRLIKTELFGHKLCKVSKSMLVSRYNKCLEQIGIEPTKLKSFHIDGWGWSPEIADEKENRYYLSHGMANPYGIILSPEQKNSPLYMPYHTFDWNIHWQIFDNYEAQIIDITADQAIWIELDQNISMYRSPSDVLLMDLVHIKFYLTGNLQEEARKQKALIDHYLSDTTAWMDAQLRQKIINSSKEFGDLRYRNLDIPDFHRGNISTYFTVAFGGLYVFRNSNNQKPMMILSDNSSKQSGELNHNHIEFNIDDLSYIPYLYNHQLVDTSGEYLSKNLFLIELHLQYLLIKCILEEQPETSVDEINANQKKKFLFQLSKKGKLPDIYFELETVLNSIKKNQKLDTTSISEELRMFLLHPATDRSRDEKIIIWQLLTNIQDSHPVLLYVFDKSSFYNKYQGFSENMKSWTVSELLKHKKLFQTLID